MRKARKTRKRRTRRRRSTRKKRRLRRKRKRRQKLLRRRRRLRKRRRRRKARLMILLIPLLLLQFRPMAIMWLNQRYSILFAALTNRRKRESVKKTRVILTW